MDPNEHLIAAITIVYVRCTCGWSERLENLKGKSDEELSVEVGALFAAHKAKFQ